MYEYIYEKRCPMCGRWTTIGLTEDESKRLGCIGVTIPNIGTLKIQDVLPEFDPFEREFLITGYCPECQEVLFDTKYNPSGRLEIEEDK